MHEAGVYSVCFREIAFAKMAQRSSLDGFLDGKVLYVPHPQLPALLGLGCDEARLSKDLGLQ